MASYSIAAGAIGVYGKTLVANTVDTITFPGDVTGSIEVSTNGSAALYFTVDGSTPTVGGAATHELLAGAVAARIVQSVEVGTTVVKVISAGTPTYSVAVASMTDVPWFSSQTGTSVSAGSGGVVAKTSANSGAAYTVAAPTHGDRELALTLTANTTITLTGGGTSGELCGVELRLIQDATGSRTVTWPANIDWGSGGAPALSTAAGKTDRVYITTDDAGATWQGSLIGLGYTSPVAPSAPSSLVATPGNAQNVLTWTQGATVTGAPVTQNEIWRGTSSGAETLLTTISAATTYTDTGLTNGTAYYYKVKAVNTVGTSGFSGEATATPANITTIASDNFNRSDTTATTASNGLIGQTTPVGAKAWLNLISSRLWDIASNVVKCSNIGRAGIDAGVADCTVSVDYTVGVTPADGGMLCRWVDANNFMNIMVDPGGIYLQKTVAGAQSNVGNGGGAQTSGAVTLKCVMSGSSVIVYRNGVQVVSATVSDAALLTATKHGLYGSPAFASETWDNFSVTVP